MKERLVLAPRTARRLMPALLLLVLTALAVPAQSVPSPEMEKAREETAVVYDLARFFGYVYGMTTEEESLALTTGQRRELLAVMEEIRRMERVEPDWAEATLERLELDLLTPAQLMEVDRRAIEWERERTSPALAGGGGGAGTGAGSGGGSGPLSSYVAGGSFNPLLDATKPLGEGFASLYDYLK